tara:strand:- start:242 stop:658 length:417 start_codon:yes stop_codon:yes gene_type:complete
MKIAGTGPVQKSTIRRRDGGGKAAGAGFAAQLSPSRASSGVSGPAQAGPMDGLLLLQEVDDDGQGKRQARDHGEALLDKLDEIRDALLAGAMSSATLDGLLRRIRQQKGTYADPRLREILGEIELRVAVELAKFGQSR